MNQGIRKSSIKKIPITDIHILNSAGARTPWAAHCHSKPINHNTLLEPSLGKSLALYCKTA